MFLVYRYEAVIPLEVQIPSLRIVLTTELTDEEKHRLRLQELEALDDKCLQAYQQIKLYQALEFLEPSIRKSENGFSRKMNFS